MIQTIYTIKDHSTGQHQKPFFAANANEAKRIIASALLQESLLSQHPMDFSIHSIGIFDTDTGELIPEEKLCILPDMQSLIRPKQNEQIQ